MKDCDACQSTKEESDLHKTQSFYKDEIYLCKVCYSTFASKLAVHPQNEITNRDIIQTVAFCANLILDAINRKGS